MEGTEDRPPEAFSELVPMAPPPGMERFVAAVRHLQDLTVSTNPVEDGWTVAAERLEELCTSLAAHRVPSHHAPAGKTRDLPGSGNPMFPPWQVSQRGDGGVVMSGRFTRAHVGGNNAVHGGFLPLLYDWHFGLIAAEAGRPISRTAYLHVDYRNVTPIDQPLIARGRVANIDGRKAFVEATMTDSSGTILSEANGLMIHLLSHHS